MKGSSDVEFKIESSKLGELYSIGLTLDDNFLSFRNLRTKTRLAIVDCRNLWLVSLEGFRQPSARGWKYGHAKKKISSHVPSTHTHEDADFDALPSLECLDIRNCGINRHWLSLMWQHMRALEELHLKSCNKISRAICRR